MPRCLCAVVLYMRGRPHLRIVCRSSTSSCHSRERHGPRSPLRVNRTGQTAVGTLQQFRHHGSMREVDCAPCPYSPSTTIRKSFGGCILALGGTGGAELPKVERKIPEIETTYHISPKWTKWKRVCRARRASVSRALTPARQHGNFGQAGPQAPHQVSSGGGPV